MSDINKSLKTLIDFQKSIDLITRNPFDSIIKQQEKMLRVFNDQKRLVESFGFSQLGHESLKGVSAMLAESARLSHFGTDVLNGVAQQLQNDIIATCGIAGSISEQLTSLQNLTPLLSAIHNITVTKNYVSFPEALIPDNFQYEEVSDPTSINSGQNEEQDTNTKNLSLSNALALINLFTMILVFLLTPFYNHAIENTLSEKAEEKPNEPITEEQAQQMLDYLSELTNYQQAILTALETSHESVQESVSIPSDIGLTPSGTDSTPSNADSDSQCIPPPLDLAEESHPIGVDGSENSEPH